MILVEVYTQNPIAHNQKLTYESDVEIPTGCRVLIELRNRQIVGFVDRCYEGEVDFETKKVLEVIDDEPIITKELFDLAQWLSYQTLSPMIRCLQAILPNPLRPSKSFKAPVIVRMIRLMDVDETLTPRQTEVVEVLKKQGEMPYSDVHQKDKAIVRALIKKGVIEQYEIERDYEEEIISVTSEHKKLTVDQQKAVETVTLNNYQSYLLFGATGSGKTEVYLQIAQKVIDQKKQVLILVPEISLTPQMIERFESRFGQDIGIYHSGLNNQEKYEQYKRVKENKVNIIVGTRSCVFLPFSNLGLIVLDEEHDPSFKQETLPYYHAREVAHYRAKLHNCPIILGSASPSLESYAKAIKNVYTLITLPQRINESFPEVKVIDMRAQLRQLKNEVISQELDNAIRDALEHKQQIILLLNRRSYSPIVQCQNCQKALECPHCDTTLAYHKESNAYICHTCGYSQRDNTCNHCGGKAVMMKGLGTQRLEEVIKHKYPSATVARMDADTTKRKNAHFKLLNKFQNREIDILVGTQMIAKGLDMPYVTIVGILQADASLMHDDFSSTEKAFSLILQASGRAGRHDLKGSVYVQSYLPDHYAIQYALRQNYIGFFQEEMNYRHQGNYPPYIYLCEIVLSHTNLEKINELAQRLAYAARNKGLNTLGPAPLRKLSTMKRARIVIKHKNHAELLEKIHQIHEECEISTSNIQVIFNVNPQQLSI